MTHGIDKDLWYRQGLMVLTTPMVLTKIHCIETVILNPTRTRGPSVTRMRDFLRSKSFEVVMANANSSHPTLNNDIKQ